MHTLIRVDVLVMLALLSLRAGSVDRPIGECFALPQARSDLDSVHGTRLLVLIPSGSCDVSPDDGFNGENSKLAHLHASVLKHWPK
jgi:hypothetical protein